MEFAETSATALVLKQMPAACRATEAFMKGDKYAVIILAAGYSSRMEAFKPLLEIDGVTVTDRLISIFLSNDVDVFLVTGWKGKELPKGIKHRDFQTLENLHYEAGMFGSIQAGVRRLTPHHRAFFVMPVDIPLVRPETIRCLLENASVYHGEILYPVFCSRRGHPPLIPSSLIGEILSSPLTGNLRDILTAHRDISREIMVADRYICMDMDTQEDYSRLRRDFREYHIPTDEECNVLLDMAETEDDTRRHCAVVAEVATALSRALEESGNQVNSAEVRAAALLHDIAKGQAAHSLTGGQLLRKSGFSRIGELVEAHETREGSGAPAALEAKIVFLADKFVLEENIVSIEERYRAATERHGVIPGTIDKIVKQERETLRAKREIEGLLHHNLDADYCRRLATRD